MKTHTICKFRSKYNGTIELVSKKNKYSLLVDSVTESGPEIEEIWDEAFRKLTPNIKVNDILVLGFGAGSVMKSIRRHYPRSFVVGVEIDPIILKIAKKYFPENVAGVKLMRRNAIQYVADTVRDNNVSTEKKMFDLIIVDCYIGSRGEDLMKKIIFLQLLKQIGDTILFNQLFLPNKIDEMKKIEFLKDLDKLYTVKALKLPYNIIIEY